MKKLLIGLTLLASMSSFAEASKKQLSSDCINMYKNKIVVNNKIMEFRGQLQSHHNQQLHSDSSFEQFLFSVEMEVLDIKASYKQWQKERAIKNELTNENQFYQEFIDIINGNASNRDIQTFINKFDTIEEVELSEFEQKITQLQKYSDEACHSNEIGEIEVLSPRDLHNRIMNIKH